MPLRQNIQSWTGCRAGCRFSGQSGNLILRGINGNADDIHFFSRYGMPILPMMYSRYSWSVSLSTSTDASCSTTMPMTAILLSSFLFPYFHTSYWFDKRKTVPRKVREKGHTCPAFPYCTFRRKFLFGVRNPWVRYVMKIIYCTLILP